MSLVERAHEPKGKEGNRWGTGKWILLLAALAFPLIVIYGLYSYPRVTAEVDSVSPDGRFRCRIVERANVGQCYATIHLYRKRENLSWLSKWSRIEEGRISNDSCCAAYYHVNWETDGAGRAVGVNVTSDLGPSRGPEPVRFKEKLN